jgi:nitroreductase
MYLKGAEVDVIEAIKTRRSIRHYKPAPINDKDLTMVLEAARWAPSWANTQCTRLLVIKDKQTKAKLAETLTQGNPAAAATVAAPVVIVACAELKKSGYKAGQPRTDKGDWFMFDVALGMQNLTLAAHALGLGTVHVGSFDAGKVASILNVPEGFAVVEMIPLGYPAAEGKVHQRKELSEIVFYERWGKASSQST